MYGRLATITHDEPLAPGATDAEELAPVEGQRVGLDDAHTAVLDLGAQERDETPVDLHRGDRRTGLGQGEGERTETGADLDHGVPGPDPRQPGDAAHGVGVDDEVLTEGTAGTQTVLVEELLDLAPSEASRHQWCRRRGRRALTS